MMRTGLRVLALWLLLAPVPLWAQAGREALTAQQCDFVAILGQMTHDLRAIGASGDPGVQAAHRQIVAGWLAMTGPGDILSARATPALQLHADDINDFLGGVSAYLQSGGAILAIPGLVRMEHMSESFACPTPADARAQALIAARPEPGGRLARIFGAFAKPELLLVSERIYGSPWHKAMFLFGLALFAAASGVMIHRNQRQRRMQRRHPCHIPAALRQGRQEREVRIKDLSCMGAKITRPEGEVMPGRLWLRVEGVWISARVAWRNAHFLGLDFDLPLSMAQLRLALRNAPPYLPPPAPYRAPLRSATQPGAEVEETAVTVQFQSRRGRAAAERSPG